MTRVGSLSRISIAAAALLLVAACSSDGAASNETIDPALIEDINRSDDLLILNEDLNTERRLAECDDLGLGPEECGLIAADSGALPVEQTVTTVSPLSESVLPEGFSTVMVEITKADGEVCEVCMWLADSAAERGQGLMGVTSLGTPKGMAFVWEQPTSGAFFMFQTVTPLSIAWFAEPTDPDAGGELVSTDDMDPCLLENSAECERFPPGGEFVLAIEVFQGDLASIGITEGATARLVPGSEAIDCPLR